MPRRVAHPRRRIVVAPRLCRFINMFCAVCIQFREPGTGTVPGTYSTVKRHRGSRDTHGTHKRTRGHTEDTDEPHKHPNPKTHPHDHATAETRNRGRLNSSKYRYPSESAAGRVGSGPAAVHAAVESAAVSAVAWSCGCVVGFGCGCEVRLCDPCARVRPCVPCVSRVCPGSPRCLFTGVFLLCGFNADSNEPRNGMPEARNMGIGVFFNTRKGQFQYKISSYIIIYHVAIMIYHCVSSSVS